MNAKVSITVFILFFSLCANAQGLNNFENLNSFQNLDGFLDDWRQLTRPNPERPNTSASSKRRNRRIPVFPPTWNQGLVLLSDGSVLEGSVSYNIAKDIVQVESRDTARIFAANQIRHFEIYKSRPQIRRDSVEVKTNKTRFYSLPYAEKNGYSRPKLFEVVVNGNTGLLRRWIHGTAYYDRKLYLINPEGKITQIKKRRGSVIKGFDGKHEELKAIAKEENLDMYEMRDVMRLVEAYNSLAEQNR